MKTLKVLSDGKVLGLNINEILLEEKLFIDDQNLNSYFFDCQCAIILLDITTEDGLPLVKQLINTIIINLNCSFLKKILIVNKIDLQEERKVSNYELNDYINEFGSEFDDFEISLKTKDNIEKIWDKVYECVNKTYHKIPINLLSENVDIIKDNEDFFKTEGSINLILIGDSGVGKSNLFSRYFHNKFEDNFISTIGMDRQSKLIKYKNKNYRVNISDTAGQERFRSLPIKYYQYADGALLLFDITEKDSFQNINIWMEDLTKNSRALKQAIYLIGNKIDLPNRSVSQEDAKELAEKLNLQYYEMSCKLNMNIYEIVSRLIYDCLNNLNEAIGFQINKKKKQAKKGCC